MDKNTEIDLWELISDGIKFFRKKRKIILIFFLAGILFSISNFFIHPLQYKDYYKKEFIAQSSVASNEILFDIINGLPDNLKNSPDFRNLKGTMLANINKETRLKVTIEVYEPNDIDSILKSITAYVDSINSLREKFEMSRLQSRKLLLLLNQKIGECDSSKKITRYSDCLDLIQRKQNIEKDLALNRIVSFVVINPDYVFESNRGAGFLNVFGFGFLGIVIGFIAAYLSEFISRKK